MVSRQPNPSGVFADDVGPQKFSSVGVFYSGELTDNIVITR